MLFAYIGAIPMPMNAVKIPKITTLLSANIARRVHPTMLIKKLKMSVPSGFNFIEINQFCPLALCVLSNIQKENIDFSKRVKRTVI